LTFAKLLPFVESVGWAEMSEFEDCRTDVLHPMTLNSDRPSLNFVN
jgi:hypothetical protein